MAVNDWNTTPGLNTSISGINIGEGCAPGNINDAIRQMMADVKTVVATDIPAAYQAKDADLTAIAALTSAANKVPYATGAGTWALADLSVFARTILDDADAATVRTTIGAQASDAALTSLAGLSLAAGDVLYATGADTVARLAIGTAGQVLRVNTGATAPEWATVGNITWLASQATTSGSSVDVTGIPSTATEVFVSMEGNSLSLSGNFLIQLGHSGGIISTGYLGYCDTVQSTSGFPVLMAGATRVVHGTWQFRKPTGNLWVGSFAGARVGISGLSGGGQLDMSANVLDRIRITSDGADTLDAGAIRVGYR